MSFDVLLHELLTNPAFQSLAIGVIGQGLHKVFSLLDSKPVREDTKVVLNCIFVFLTLLANLVDAWSKGHAGLVDASQWTQFIVMLAAVFGFHGVVVKPAAQKLGAMIRKK